MPANVGEMFYTGAVPWHGLGRYLTHAATLEQAIEAAGLDWNVGDVNLVTAENPPSPISKRKGLVRLDRKAGDSQRVLGVAHRGFAPIQNREAGLLFDAIFGNGQPVYHTGGYLGAGEVIWLLAKIDSTIRIGSKDVIEPYALLANSHDGSMALNIRLTTIRVVCQNTLALAMDQHLGRQFRRSHQGPFSGHARAAQDFFKATLSELNSIGDTYVQLSKRKCSEEAFGKIVSTLLPEPKRPRSFDQNPGLRRAWENRLAEVTDARKKISELRESGKGMDLDGSRGTFWGVLNAILEYVDHHRKVEGPRISYVLLGNGMDLKARAFGIVRDEFAKAA
jgi:phage/plasmid-like protein (TIGR03299 family)